MKSAKKAVMSFALLFLFAGLLTGSCITASAAVKVPKKIRIYPASADESLEITLDKPDEQIANIKTSSKNLKARETHRNINVSYEGEIKQNRRSITLYAKTPGRYTLTFDVLKADKTKKASRSVAVFAYSDSAVKEITLNGERPNTFMTKNSGKLLLTMNPGYTLKKIEVGKYVKKVSEDGKSISSERKYTTVKNGANISLSRVPYEYRSESGTLHPSEGDPAPSKYYYENWSTRVFADTEIRVTYIDKYTKKEATAAYLFYKLLI